MHRSFAWGMIALLAIMLAPFAGVLGVPASTVHADTAAPSAAADDEIIVITAAGQLRVDDPYTPVGYKAATWNSGAETGFTVVASGDFNGDGDAELVAARGSLLKVFDPVVQPGKASVQFTTDLGSGRNVRLLVTGDFDADGKDEFAVMNYAQGTNIQAALQVFDGGTNATAGEWTRRNYAEYNAMFQDMSTGDFNGDGIDDLVMVRNAGTQRLVLVLNVFQQLTTIAQDGNFCCNWFAVAGGNLSASTPGDEISLLRYGGNATRNCLVLFRVVAGAFVDLAPGASWKFEPEFYSLSDGDLNGDGDDEVVMLRNPLQPKTSLMMVNAFGETMNTFEQATGYGSTAFAIVRTGDTDGDGKDEVVILKADRYRIYTEPNVDSRATETTGAFYTYGNPGTVSNLPFLAVANVDGPGIAEGPTLSVTPSSLSFSLDCGDVSPLKPLNISNVGTGSSFAWQAQAIEGSDWLLLNGSQAVVQGTTPGTVNVSVKNINKGAYTGKIRITTTDPAVQNKTVDVPVSYASLCSGFVASPTPLNFDVPWGSTGSQSVTIGSAGPTAWTATVVPVNPTTSCSWVTLSAMFGTTPSTLNVLASSTAAGVGSKQCLIIFSTVDPSVPNSPQTVTVNLTVPDPGFVTSPSEITIWQETAAPPVTRQIKIERPKAPTNWTASALEGISATELDAKLASGEASITDGGIVIDGVLAPPPAWLQFTPTLGTTPTTMTVSVKAGTSVGTYHGRIFIVASGFPTEEVNVTALVAADFHFTFLPMTIQ